MEHKVVVTGMGCISPIGNNIKDFWNSVKNGKNGINYITRFDASNYKVKVAAEVKNFDSSYLIEMKDQKKIDLFTKYALCAADEAVKDSNFMGTYDSERVGVYVGSGIGGIGSLQKEVYKLLNEGPNHITPFIVPLMIINLASGRIAIKYNAKGVNLPVVAACSTGALAIGEAYHAIKYGFADVIIAGGAEAAITEISIAGFASMQALSKSENINRASIPFDKERNGFVMGEGAGIVILERADLAEKRGAKIYCEITGFGSTCDAYHITAPNKNGEQISRAIMMALENCYKNEDKVYINAHGTSTVLNDLIETHAIKNVFKDNINNVFISSTKSMIGHMLGAAGAVEFIVTIKALNENILPPTINYLVKDEELDLNYIPNNAIEQKVDIGLNNSIGFGGHNVCLAIKSYK